MKISYSDAFKKDLLQIKDKSILKRIKTQLLGLKEAKDISTSKLTKLKGHPFAFRLRVGDYRIGCYAKSSEQILISRIAPRKEIYKIFP